MGRLHPWIYEYYIDPIVYDTGYNPVNTVTWALVLGLMLIGVMRLFRRLDIRIDEPFVLSTTAYILAGSTLRVVEDADLLAAPLKYLLITPLIYFLVAAVALSALVFFKTAVKERYLFGYAAVGLCWTGANLILLASLGGGSLAIPAVIIMVGSSAALAAWAVGRWLDFQLLSDRLNLLILWAHMMDATSTYFGVDWFGYHEKHVLPNFLIDLSGTALVMFPLKLLIIIPILALIEGGLRDDPSLRNLTLLALLTLGLAPALRNTIRLTLGV